GAVAGGPHNKIRQVNVGCVEESAFFAGGENGDSVGGSRGAEIGALERVDSDIHFGEECFRRVRGEADSFADVKHRSFVAFAFADDDGAVHLHRVHGFAH